MAGSAYDAIMAKRKGQAPADESPASPSTAPKAVPSAYDAIMAKRGASEPVEPEAEPPEPVTGNFTASPPRVMLPDEVEYAPGYGPDDSLLGIAKRNFLDPLGRATASAVENYDPGRTEREERRRVGLNARTGSLSGGGEPSTDYGAAGEAFLENARANPAMVAVDLPNAILAATEAGGYKPSLFERTLTDLASIATGGMGLLAGTTAAGLQDVFGMSRRNPNDPGSGLVTPWTSAQEEEAAIAGRAPVTDEGRIIAWRQGEDDEAVKLGITTAPGLFAFDDEAGDRISGVTRALIETAQRQAVPPEVALAQRLVGHVDFSGVESFEPETYLRGTLGGEGYYERKQEYESFSLLPGLSASERVLREWETPQRQAARFVIETAAKQGILGPAAKADPSIAKTWIQMLNIPEFSTQPGRTHFAEFSKHMVTAGIEFATVMPATAVGLLGEKARDEAWETHPGFAAFSVVGPLSMMGKAGKRGIEKVGRLKKTGVEIGDSVREAFASAMRDVSDASVRDGSYDRARATEGNVGTTPAADLGTGALEVLNAKLAEARDEEVATSKSGKPALAIGMGDIARTKLPNIESGHKAVEGPAPGPIGGSGRPIDYPVVEVEVPPIVRQMQDILAVDLPAKERVLDSLRAIIGSIRDQVKDLAEERAQAKDAMTLDRLPVVPGTTVSTLGGGPMIRAFIAEMNEVVARVEREMDGATDAKIARALSKAKAELREQYLDFLRPLDAEVRQQYIAQRPELFTRQNKRGKRVVSTKSGEGMARQVLSDHRKQAQALSGEIGRQRVEAGALLHVEGYEQTGLPENAPRPAVPFADEARATRIREGSRLQKLLDDKKERDALLVEIERENANLALLEQAGEEWAPVAKDTEARVGVMMDRLHALEVHYREREALFSPESALAIGRILERKRAAVEAKRLKQIAPYLRGPLIKPSDYSLKQQAVGLQGRILRNQEKLDSLRARPSGEGVASRAEGPGMAPGLNSAKTNPTFSLEADYAARIQADMKALDALNALIRETDGVGDVWVAKGLEEAAKADAEAAAPPVPVLESTFAPQRIRHTTVERPEGEVAKAQKKYEKRVVKKSEKYKTDIANATKARDDGLKSAKTEAKRTAVLETYKKAVAAATKERDAKPLPPKATTTGEGYVTGGEHVGHRGVNLPGDEVYSGTPAFEAEQMRVTRKLEIAYDNWRRAVLDAANLNKKTAAEYLQDLRKEERAQGLVKRGVQDATVYENIGFDPVDAKRLAMQGRNQVVQMTITLREKGVKDVGFIDEKQRIGRPLENTPFRKLLNPFDSPGLERTRKARMAETGVDLLSQKWQRAYTLADYLTHPFAFLHIPRVIGNMAMWYMSNEIVLPEWAGGALVNPGKRGRLVEGGQGFLGSVSGQKLYNLMYALTTYSDALPVGAHEMIKVAGHRAAPEIALLMDGFKRLDKKRIALNLPDGLAPKQFLEAIHRIEDAPKEILDGMKLDRSLVMRKERVTLEGEAASRLLHYADDKHSNPISDSFRRLEMFGGRWVDVDMLGAEGEAVRLTMGDKSPEFTTWLQQHSRSEGTRWESRQPVDKMPADQQAYTRFVENFLNDWSAPVWNRFFGLQVQAFLGGHALVNKGGRIFAQKAMSPETFMKRFGRWSSDFYDARLAHLKEFNLDAATDRIISAIDNDYKARHGADWRTTQPGLMDNFDRETNRRLTEFVDVHDQILGSITNPKDPNAKPLSKMNYAELELRKERADQKPGENYVSTPETRHLQHQRGWKELTAKERIQLGLHDWAATMAQSIQITADYLGYQQMLERFVENGWLKAVDETAPFLEADIAMRNQGFLPVPKSHVSYINDLAGGDGKPPMYVQGDLLQHLVSSATVYDGMHQVLRKAMGLWKLGKVINPLGGTMQRNILFNMVGLNFMGDAPEAVFLQPEAASLLHSYSKGIHNEAVAIAHEIALTGRTASSELSSAFREAGSVVGQQLIRDRTKADSALGKPLREHLDPAEMRKVGVMEHTLSADAQETVRNAEGFTQQNDPIALRRLGPVYKQLYREGLRTGAQQYEFWSGLYGSIDDTAKMAHYLYRLRQEKAKLGRDLTSQEMREVGHRAKAEAQATYMDYSDVSPLLDVIRMNTGPLMAPFATWTAKAGYKFFELMAEKPSTAWLFATMNQSVNKATLAYLNLTADPMAQLAGNPATGGMQAGEQFLPMKPTMTLDERGQPKAQYQVIQSGQNALMNVNPGRQIGSATSQSWAEMLALVMPQGSVVGGIAAGMSRERDRFDANAEYGEEMDLIETGLSALSGLGDTLTPSSITALRKSYTGERTTEQTVLGLFGVASKGRSVMSEIGRNEALATRAVKAYKYDAMDAVAKAGRYKNKGEQYRLDSLGRNVAAMVRAGIELELRKNAPEVVAAAKREEAAIMAWLATGGQEVLEGNLLPQPLVEERVQQSINEGVQQALEMFRNEKAAKTRRATVAP